MMREEGVAGLEFLQTSSESAALAGVSRPPETGTLPRNELRVSSVPQRLCHAANGLLGLNDIRGVIDSGLRGS
jgi:hypothetical protein